MADRPAKKPSSAPVERARSEVYGMSIETIIASANSAFPPAPSDEDAAEVEPPNASPWTSIEEQMANPMPGARPRRGKRQ
jgi:hypothetical protein